MSNDQEKERASLQQIRIITQGLDYSVRLPPELISEILAVLSKNTLLGYGQTPVVK